MQGMLDIAAFMSHVSRIVMSLIAKLAASPVHALSQHVPSHNQLASLTSLQVVLRLHTSKLVQHEFPLFVFRVNA